MNLTMISKSLLIALPMLALGACSSTGDTESESTTQTGTEQSTEATMDNTVQTDTIEAVTLTDEELMVQEYTAAILETTINFDFDNAVIKPQYIKVLDAHAKYLLNNPKKSVTIEGHTDEKGTPEYNIALGERRAMSVSTYLENMGVASAQISVVSYGEEKPVNFSHDEAALADNRRAELTY
ncbi:peptidoglycan-associated lipoprotein Pal [Psychromonas antarctica]|jgi:peptidoglycan-associated lipoprotein|uniref:peptidoglycan-associated lipoprotein Pal n=1 Tax=Psychromonas antarctica TaxID=67573 RepID=UPI001EE98C64|nr:peptidoglycan-associated lipoprotein Pal [Psychromonas antarctica]MCG6202432.1 peptidoglycan-associated lipoprotein Pal [Psychromonas antarctica]